VNGNFLESSSLGVSFCFGLNCNSLFCVIFSPFIECVNIWWGK
jgi:hypothetical protein